MPDSARPEDHMRHAIQLSRTHMQAGHGGPFGAVVVKDGQVVGEGWNQVTSANDPTAHAEVMAIRDACARLGTHTLAGCELYTSCEPCPMCLAATYWARIDRLYFANTRDEAAAIGFDDALLYQEIGKSIADRRLWTRRILGSEALEVFNAWMAKDDKIAY